MNQKEFTKEVALVSAIMGDCITKKLYKRVQETGHGYMETVDIISDWAIEFANKHKNTNWEKVLMDESIKPMSKTIKSIICFDDAVMDFAHHKLNEYKK